MERVLDTAALLHWPVERLVGGVCAVSQQEELQRLDASRSMLVETVELEWRAVPKAWLALATQHASETGDLPRLSDVDLDVLALALGLGARLVTDDYRMQNTFKHAGGVVEAVANRVSKAVWLWELRCTGCRDVTDVPADVERSKNRPAGECKRCGSPMLVKRRRAP